MNLNQIIIQQKRDDKRYRRFSERVFYRALREQVEPILENTNLTVQVQPMFDAYNRVYQYVGIESAKKEYLRIKKQEGQKADPLINLLLNTWSEWMRGYVIQNLGQMIQRVSNNTQDAISRALQDSLEIGETRNQTLKRIYKYTLGEIGRNRAKVIARTETTRATNVGKRKSSDDWSMFNGGVEMYKKWIHIPTPEFRKFHLELANEMPIPKDSAFIVRNPKGGLNSMMMPGDASAPGNQTINCNCTTIYMSERYARRNYGIDRPQINKPIISNQFTPAQTIDEAKAYVRNLFNERTRININRVQISSSLPLDKLNKYNRQLTELINEYDTSPLYDKRFEVPLLFESTKKYLGIVKSVNSTGQLRQINFGNITPKPVTNRVTFESGKYKFAKDAKVDNDKSELYVVTHEFGHYISMKNLSVEKSPMLKSFWSEINDLRQSYWKEIKAAHSKIDVNTLNDIYLGDYAGTNIDEFMAEGFTEYKLNSNPSKYAIQIGKTIDKYFKRK